MSIDPRLLEGKKFVVNKGVIIVAIVCLLVGFVSGVFYTTLKICNVL